MNAKHHNDRMSQHICPSRYSNIVMTGVDSPFQFYIGARMLRPPPVGQPGSISDIVVQNVTASSMFNTFKSRNWTATLDGQPPDPSRGVVGESVQKSCTSFFVSQ